jgi:hypothetical protein
MTMKAVLFGILMASATLPLGAGERISMKVSPQFAFAPATLIVRATIDADSENRAVEIVAESADFYRSSEISLEGEQAPRTSVCEFHGLPSGTYTVKAVLFGTDGRQRALAQKEINVISGGSGE